MNFTVAMLVRGIRTDSLRLAWLLSNLALLRILTAILCHSLWLINLKSFVRPIIFVVIYSIKSGSNKKCTCCLTAGEVKSLSCMTYCS